MKKSLLLVLLLIISMILTGCKEKENPTSCGENEHLVENECISTKEFYNNGYCQFDKATNLLACNKTWSQYLHTTVTITVYFDQYEALDSKEMFGEIEEIISYYNETSDKYKDYEGVVNIKAINDNPTAIHTLDERLFDLVEFTLENQDKVDNLFNAALGPVLQVWHDYRENCNLNNVCSVPTFEELNQLKPNTNPDDIVLDRENLTIQMKEGMSIDLGGVSKGYITDEIIDVLESYNLYGYLINNGTSNISVGGLRPKRDSGEFYVGVLDPRNKEWENNAYAVVHLAEGEHLVTSGDYQQYYEADGEFYHHIIHNDTLFPERYSRAVSIVSNDPALADLYSTAIFLMPIEDGIAFVNNTDNLEAIWFDLNNEIHMSANFESEHLGDILID